MNGLVLKACIHIGKCHDDSRASHGLIHLDLHAVFIGAELDARNISGSQDRPGVVGHVAVTGFPYRQDGHACWLQELFAELLAELTGPGIPGIVQGCEQERQKGHVHLRIIGLPVGCAHLHHSLYRTGRDLFQKVGLAAQGRVRVDVYSQIASGPLLHRLLKALEGNAGGVGGAHGRSDIQRIGGLARLCALVLRALVLRAPAGIRVFVFRPGILCLHLGRGRGSR